METLTCFSYACSAVPKETRDILKYSNKIILPASMLHKIEQNEQTEYPLFFKVINKDLGWGIVCAVHEFTATEGIVNIPYDILSDLGLSEGTDVDLEYINPPQGSYMKLKPFETQFTELTDPRSVLEHHISRNYPVVSQGQILNINYLDTVYRIEIVETQPSETIKIINTDVNIDFDVPYDYIEPPKETPNPVPQINNFTQETKNSPRNEKIRSFGNDKFVPFSGKGHVLGSK